MLVGGALIFLETLTAPIVPAGWWRSGPVQHSLLLACMLIGAVLILFIGWWWYGYVWRLERSLRRMDHLACLDCRYDLRGAPAEGVCPECGRPYSLDATALSWRAQFNRHRFRRALKRECLSWRRLLKPWWRTEKPRSGGLA